MKLKDYKKIKNPDALKKAKIKLRKKFNKYIVLRDLNLNEETNEIYGNCIACGKRINVTLFSDKSIANGRTMHASHFLNTDKYPGLEFYEDNVHLSCAKCNSPYGLHGNKEHYQPNLIKKIGEERYEELIKLSKSVLKLSILDIELIESIIKIKLKDEAKRLNIKHY